MRRISSQRRCCHKAALTVLLAALKADMSRVCKYYVHASFLTCSNTTICVGSHGRRKSGTNTEHLIVHCIQDQIGEASCLVVRRSTTLEGHCPVDKTKCAVELGVVDTAAEVTATLKGRKCDMP